MQNTYLLSKYSKTEESSEFEKYSDTSIIDYIFWNKIFKMYTEEGKQDAVRWGTGSTNVAAAVWLWLEPGLVTLGPQTPDSDHWGDIQRHRDIGDHGAGETWEQGL